MPSQCTHSEDRVDDLFTSRIMNVLSASTFPDYRPDFSSTSPMELLAATVGAVDTSVNCLDLWLIQSGFLARYPTTEEFQAFQRRLTLGDNERAIIGLMEDNLYWGGKSIQYQIATITGVPIVELSYILNANMMNNSLSEMCQMIMHWGRNSFIPVKWDDKYSTLLLLSYTEWDDIVTKAPHLKAMTPHLAESPTLIVPFDADLVFVSLVVDSFDKADRLAAMSKFANVRLSFLFPQFSLYSPGEGNRTAAKFSILKHAKRVVVREERLAQELSGLFSALPAQGLISPEVATFPFPETDSLEASRAWDDYACGVWGYLNGSYSQEL
jgi:hypothetical protein